MMNDNVTKYRSKMRILADMLLALKSEGDIAIPTRMMLKANLSYDRLEKYLSQLKQLGLLEELSDGQRASYRLTENGLKFLVEFHKVVEFSKIFSIPI